MNKKSIFTIVTKNYIGLATILGQSILRLHDDVDFFVFISDELDETLEIPKNDFHYIEAVHNINIDKKLWYEMAFKYNLVEFCTAIKPFCFSRQFENGYEKVIYLDPDIFLFSDFSNLFNDLDKYKIILTPHICTCDVNYNGSISENEFLNAGIYNCGFVAMSKSSKIMQYVKWWEKRLVNRCFSTPEESLFTDQKWMNFATCFFGREECLIQRSLGYNIAPWNFFEREIVKEKSQLYVRNRITKENVEKIVFVHYSGYDYFNIDVNNSRYFSSVDFFSDLTILFETYQNEIDNPIIKKFLNLKYSYLKYSNGLIIDTLHRRLFRRLLIEEFINYNPFQEESTFYQQLKKKGLLYGGNERFDNMKFTDETHKVFENKIIIINKLATVLFKIIGPKKFSLMVRFFSKYFRYENFIFLYDQKFLKKAFNKNYLS